MHATAYRSAPCVPPLVRSCAGRLSSVGPQVLEEAWGGKVRGALNLYHALARLPPEVRRGMVLLMATGQRG